MTIVQLVARVNLFRGQGNWIDFSRIKQLETADIRQRHAQVLACFDLLALSFTIRNHRLNRDWRPNHRRRATKPINNWHIFIHNALKIVSDLVLI